MLSKEDFIKYIVHGPQVEIKSETKQEESGSALPEGFDSFGFDSEDEVVSVDTGDSSFAHNLLIASGFGNPEHIERSEVILSTDAAAKHLPNLVYYWPKNDDRPYQTLLFELEQSGLDVLKTKLFKQSGKQQLLEDTLSRFVQHTLRGFEKGGEKRTASVRQGKQTETLCIISVVDDRDKENDNTHLVCFGTKNKANDSLETFHIREEAKLWEPQIREDHLGKLYDRHFKKLTSGKWQNAFISKEERKLARRLLETCIDDKASEHDIEQSVVNLLEEIAGSYGLRRKGGKGGRRLKPFQLPKDHDIGSDPESRKDKHNPFKGMTLRDEKNRLLGYIIYCLDEKQDAEELRKYLQANNRFHNVLVIYPDGDHASLELWQGKTALPGKLLKDGAKYSGEGEVVNLLSRFFVVSKAMVKNPVELAQELAYRARYLRRLAIKELADKNEDGPLHDLYTAFKETLIHDQTEEEFADAFAQTLTYGLLTSRWMGSDKLAQSGDRFTRKTALKYLPSTSNFLAELFETALSVKLDEQRGRLFWLVDDIANLLDRIDVNYVFGVGDEESDQVTDPVIHFYEPFLSAYDNELRNNRGVYFTPRPIVAYIVRNVHELLKKEFGLEDGLASTDTWGGVQERFPTLGLPAEVKKTDPFVCILDPATGTGTFLFECIGVIEKTLKDKWCAKNGAKWNDPKILTMWRSYVKEYLLPRLFGYELMMASYSIAHLKLVFKLGKTGFSFKSDDKLNVYLTNTLEEPSDTQHSVESLFGALAQEASEVNSVKREKRFTVIIGNPPYAKLSANRGKFAESIVDPFKAPVRSERNIQPLSDDYIKFLGFSLDLSKKVKFSIISMITNRGYLNGLIHRGMRQVLLERFPKTWIVDLHGDSNVGEKAPNNQLNENVFDIQQGVAISTFIDNNSEKSNNYYVNVWGKRQEKYEFLEKLRVQRDVWAMSQPEKPYFFHAKETHKHIKTIRQMSLKKVMPVTSSGIKTHRDSLVVGFNDKELLRDMEEFRSPLTSDEKVRDLFFKKKKKGKYLPGDTSSWSLADARKNLQKEKYIDNFIQLLSYRPFDDRYLFYHPAVVDRGREKFMDHMLKDANIGLITTRQVPNVSFCHALVSTNIIEMKTCSHDRGTNIFPLYLHDDHSLFLKDKRGVNLSPDFKHELCHFLELAKDGSTGLPNTVSPMMILGYIYALLYSPGYRNYYAELLKTDFPPIPFVSSVSFLKTLSKLGCNLVKLHLMAQKNLDTSHIIYLDNSINRVEKISYHQRNIWINKKQTVGFSNVSSAVWDFRVGGYQVCEKWLKSRKGRILSNQEIAHYKKIIATIEETIRFQTEIDKVIDKHGGWPNAFVTSDQGENP